MIVNNVTWNVALHKEKKWLEWVDLRLNLISKSEKIIANSILKIETNTVSEASLYVLKYQLSDNDKLQFF